MIFVSSRVGLLAMKASADAQAGDFSMKWRTARIQARVIVSWYFEGSTPLWRRKASDTRPLGDARRIDFAGRGHGRGEPYRAAGR